MPRTLRTPPGVPYIIGYRHPMLYTVGQAPMDYSLHWALKGRWRILPHQVRLIVWDPINKVKDSIEPISDCVGPP